MDSGTFSGRYQILENLGIGGLGEVYKVIDLWTERELALKIATPEELAEDGGENFKTEFVLLKELVHPGIVEVYDFGYGEDGRPYFSMEYIKGKGVEEAFKEKGYDFLYRFIWELCEILGYLHSRGIVHCDLKLDNLKVVEGLFGVKLLDFGLSEKIGSRVGRQLKGTLDYMAPEIFSGGSLDGRTDLYSLGVILYQVTTSQLPFPSKDPVRVVAGHLEGEVIPPRKLNPKIPLILDRLVLKLLKKSPDKRYQSVNQLKRAIEERTRLKTDITRPELLYNHIYSGGIVGREKELKEIDSILKRAVGLKGQMVLLEGELGVGKSVLLKQVKLKSQLEGTLFLEGRCFENESNPYQPWVGIASNLAKYLDRNFPFFTERFRDLLNFLEDGTKNKEGVSSISGAPHIEQRNRFFNELVTFLVEGSAVSPFALSIDDLHLAGSGTLKLVELLSKRIERSRIFFCICFRTEALRTNSKLKILINRFGENSAFQQIQLGRLSFEQTKEYFATKFFGTSLPKELISYAYYYTSGNPFFLTELTKYLVKTRIITSRDSKWILDLKNLDKLDIPRKVETVIWDNIRRYDNNVIRFLSVASIVGERFNLRSIEYLSGYDEEAILLVLFVLLKDQVLRKTVGKFRGETCYEFSSRSLERLLYDRLGRRRKAELHHRMAVLLESDYSRGQEELVEEIAYHYSRTRDYLKAYNFSLVAAKKMRGKFANRQALVYLNNALRFSKMIKDKKESEYRKLEALAERGDLHRARGKLGRALKDSTAALKIAKARKDIRWVAHLCKSIGMVYEQKKDFKRGIVCLKEALRIYRSLKNPQEEADTLKRVGAIYRMKLEHRKALHNYRRALRIMNAIRDIEEMTGILNNIGVIYLDQGKYGKCLDHFKQCLSIAKRLGEDKVMTKALNNLGVAYTDLGKYNLAENHYLEALKLDRKIGDERSIYYRLHNLGDVAQKKAEFTKALDYYVQTLGLTKKNDLPIGGELRSIGVVNLEIGKYSEGKEYLEKALEEAERTKDRALQAEILLNLSKLHSLLKQDGYSEQYLLRSTKLWKKIEDKGLLASFYCDAALVKLKNSHPEQGLSFLDRAQKLTSHLGIKEREVPIKMAYCELYDKLDKKEKLDYLLKELRKLMKKREEQLYEPEYHLFSGKREWEKGHISKSLEHLETALDRAEKMGKPELLWRIHHLLGKFNLALNNVEKSYFFFDKAREKLVWLASHIKDVSLRESYLEDEDKEGLLDDMRLLEKTATHTAAAV
ncbi:MAG TPA: tetratricopeptide repeat protein [candidate division Zixibacteria bacterium]